MRQMGGKGCNPIFLKPLTRLRRGFAGCPIGPVPLWDDPDHSLRQVQGDEFHLLRAIKNLVGEPALHQNAESAEGDASDEAEPPRTAQRTTTFKTSR